VSDASGGEGAALHVEERVQQEIRDVRARWRTRQVLDAAVRLMHDGGFQAVSMQALAKEANVSVGLIYTYFGAKEDVVVAVVLDLVEQIRAAMDARMSDAGSDPVERMVAGFGAYCSVMDSQRNAGLLTYRQSGELGQQARYRLKDAERTTLVPLRDAAGEAVAAGLFVEGADIDLLAFDLMILAQTWALKHWHFPDDYDVHRYVAAQSAAALRSVLAPVAHPRYRHLISPSVPSSS
jgi:AcrR family transcriptional regulator